MTELAYSSEADLQKGLEVAKLNQTQKVIFDELTTIFIESFELPSLVVRGFYLRALIDWQKSIKMTVEETEEKMKTTFEVRKKQQEEIFDFFEKRIFKVLQVSKKSYLLKPAIDKALNHYLTNYANR